MTSFSKLSVDEKVSAIETRFKNAQENPEIMAGVATFGIDNVYTEEGITLAGAARQKSDIQKKEYAEQFEATNLLHKKLDEVTAKHYQTAKLADLVFDDESTINALKLHVALPDAVDKQIERIRSFYSILLSNEGYTVPLARYLRTVEMLTAEKDEVEAVAALRQSQTKETGEAQRATQERNEAIQQLISKDREFSTILKLAIGKRNDLLEIVGLFVRS